MEILNKYIDGCYDEMKQVLERLVKIPSVSGEAEGDYPFGKPCGEVLDEFLAVCREYGFKTENYDYYTGSADLDEKMPELAILGHLDVVPVSEKDSSFHTFACTEHNRRLYGRGCIDDKGPVVAALFAMKAVRDCKIPLKKGVRLIAGCSEETGSELDIKHYREKAVMPPMVFTPDGDFPVITTEKGMVRLTFEGKAGLESILSIKAGTVVNAVPNEAEAVLNINAEQLVVPTEFAGKTECVPKADGVHIIFKGKAAHASTPQEGDNALTGLINLLAQLPLKENDLSFVKKLAELFPYNDTKGEALGICGEDKSGALTYVFSIAELAEGRLTAKCDIRYPVSMTAEQIRTSLDHALAPEFKITDFTANKPHCVDDNSEFVQTLLRVYQRETGLEPYCKSIGGGTYVHDIEGGVAFGMEFPGENNNMHGADEFVLIESLMKSAKIYAAAIAELCGEQHTC